MTSTRYESSRARQGEAEKREARKAALAVSALPIGLRLQRQAEQQKQLERRLHEQQHEDDDSSSLGSSHLAAIRRGSTLGRNERSEREQFYNNGGTSTTFSGDTNTITTGVTFGKGVFRPRRRRSAGGDSISQSTRSPRAKPWGDFLRKGPSFSFNTDASSPRPKDLMKHAWMCCCCGNAFRTLEGANLHEEACIYDTMLRWQAAPSASRRFHRLFFAPVSSLQPSGNIRLANAVVHEDVASRHVTSPGSQSTRTLAMLKRLTTHAQSPLSFRQVHHHYVEPLEIKRDIRRMMILTDEALIKAVRKLGTSLVISSQEADAERELALLARDRAYYEARHRVMKLIGQQKEHKYMVSPRGVVGAIKRKFVVAYELIKEDVDNKPDADQYGVLRRTGTKAGAKDKGRDGRGEKNVVNSKVSDREGTLYVNVVVKNSVKAINQELERLAKIRWDAKQQPQQNANEFEKLRALARANIVKLAGLALAMDFSPRKIAVQLSNDMYLLLEPQLKRRGVSVEAEIEYREGPFFILAVNVLEIDWLLFIEHTHQEMLRRKRRWAREQQDKKEQEDTEPETTWHLILRRFCSYRQLTQYEILAHSISFLYKIHWVIALPLCTFMYRFFLRSMVRRYIITAVTDDIYHYVERRGMEMELRVKDSREQTVFMLAALEELREDDRKKKRQREDTEAGLEEKGELLGPLLGPLIPEDALDAILPQGFEPPENLEAINLEMDLPVGFRRVRWALLNSESRFMREVVMEAEAKYQEITLGDWSVHNEHIGLPHLPEGVDEAEFVGATSEDSYLMPKSAFVSANMAYDLITITVYNDYCFCFKKKTRTPDVPYGGSFFAWTQVVVTNTGKNTCRMVCSVEAEFPSGPPLVSRQIKGGMRAGTAVYFLGIGENICKYAPSVP